MTDQERDAMFVALQSAADPKSGPTPLPPETVSAHIERTVHALLDAIGGELRAVGITTENAVRIEKLAQAVGTLACWPNYHPMETR